MAITASEHSRQNPYQQGDEDSSQQEAKTGASHGDARTLQRDCQEVKSPSTGPAIRPGRKERSKGER
jgi:hypothetical protein